MKGQMTFNEFMDMCEGTPRQESRIPMVDPCYYCLCNSCINNVENIYVQKDEIPDDGWEPCFFCDDCKTYDSDTSKQDMERDWCGRYRIDNHHAWENRKKIKSVRR